MKNYFSKNKDIHGFTIIEMMIAVSLFLIVVTIGIGSLMNATSIHKRSQNTRSIMDNLSFIMEDMSRNLRTGYDYHCIDDGNFTSIDKHDCSLGQGISFKSTSGNQWVYIISVDGSIQKSVLGGEIGSFVVLTPPEIRIDPASSFSVFGATSFPADTRQPFATIRLLGNIISENNVVIPFSLQTSISQRLVDINTTP